MRALFPAISAVLLAGCLGSEADATPDEPRVESVGHWRPAAGTTWQWQVTGPVDTSYDVAMYDIDLFLTSAATIRALHRSGRVVICYFSAGSREDFRADADRFIGAEQGKRLAGWEGERWLDVRSSNVRAIMRDRLDLAVRRGCDGVEPDNVDGYQNHTGFPLTERDQLDYDRFLAAEAHARGLSIGLKNTVDLARALEPSFDWALSEECLVYGECAKLSPFVEANKAVFHVEYVDSASAGPVEIDEICSQPAIHGFSTLVKTLNLGPELSRCQ